MAAARTGWRLLTPRGAGGIAVVAVGGPGRHALLATLLRRDDAAPPARAGTPPVLAWLWLDGEPLDQALVVERADTIELHLHGAPTVVAALERRFGPFADPAPAAAERLLRDAIAPAQLALALEQRALDFAGWLAALDRTPAGEQRREVGRALRRSRAAIALAEPLRLVLCGRQNAGKSTLMNRLLLEERVRTGPEPGSTRDPVRETTELDGYPYELVDTAGEGPPATAVDAAALELARRERAGAWRLLVVDGSVGPAAVDRALLDRRTLVVRTKLDLGGPRWPDDLPLDLEVAQLDPGSAVRIRAVLGRRLRLRRGLAPAGAAGGPAALDAAQLAALRARAAALRRR
jgi:tRNA modification GTPase